MKKLFLAFSLLGSAAFAGSWTGYVCDATQGAKPATGNEAESAPCAARKDKGGLVFIVGEVIYPIADGDKRKVKDFVGKQAVVTGTLADGKLSIDSVKAPKK